MGGLRKAAAYGIGQCAKFGGEHFVPYVLESVKRLVGAIKKYTVGFHPVSISLVRFPFLVSLLFPPFLVYPIGLESQKKRDRTARDTSISALGRIISNYPAMLDVNVLLPVSATIRCSRSVAFVDIYAVCVTVHVCVFGSSCGWSSCRCSRSTMRANSFMGCYAPTWRITTPPCSAPTCRTYPK